MADWHEPFTASYRFMRVSRQTGFETEQLDWMRSGTLNINQDTATFESATVNSAKAIEFGADLVRCYLDATFYNGDEESVCLGTWLPSIPARNVDGPLEECTVYLEGRLKELQDDAFSAPILIDAGENIVSAAKAIAETAGLSVNATESSAVLKSAWVFGMKSGSDEEGGSKLDAVNALLHMAGYSSAFTDPNGNIVMEPYIDPSGRSPVWEFREGDDATFLSKATEERDSRKVANVVLAIYEDDESTVIGEAVDDDPMSPYSTISIGRRKVAKYTYHGTATQEEADAKAAELLKTNQATIRRVTINHIHCPARVGDVVALSFPRAGISGSFAIRTQRVGIGTAGCLTTSELRAFERRRNG